MPAYEDTGWTPPTDADRVLIPRNRRGGVRYYEMRGWLKEHGDGVYRIRNSRKIQGMVAFVFSDPRTAFAFRMRWN